MEKTIENAKNHRDIKLVTTEARRNSLVSEPNYHKTTIFPKYLLEIKVERTQIFMNKTVFLDISVLEMSNTCMEFGMTM